MEEVTKEEITEEQWKESWREGVKEEINDVLSKFLPITESGGWGIKYINPVVDSFEDGSVTVNEGKAVGAVMYIQLNFENEFTIETVDK